MSEDTLDGYTSFERKVWHTLSNIDVAPYIEKGAGGRQNLTYLSWASAWTLLMGEFPESTFEFDERQHQGWPPRHDPTLVAPCVRPGERERSTGGDQPDVPTTQ